MDLSKTKINELQDIFNELSLIKENINLFEKVTSKFSRQLHPKYKQSGINFFHYLALRQIKLKDLQIRLAHFGLSSLGRCESYVMNNIEQVQERISDSLRFNGLEVKDINKVKKTKKFLSWSESEGLMHQHSRDLFGSKPPDRHVYIMVTAISPPNFNKEWVRNILKAGANLIRINCAHDNVEIWKSMVTLIRKISSEIGIPCKIIMDLSGPKIRTGNKAHKKLSVGDQLFLVSDLDHPKREVQCTLPEVFKFIKIGERVLFDDGKIEAVIINKKSNKIKLEITRVPAPETKLGLGKGINFPDSEILIPEVTKQDLIDLEFVGKNADLVGLSFAQDPKAIRTIHQKIKKISNKPPGIILKIETKIGFQKFPHLLLEAMKNYPCGIMIARGDLGVEVGFERMVEVQEELLWLCEAAHIPIIWATQVLENQAKTGLPSRAEVTDAAYAVRAECVMLNKGPYIEETIQTLDNIIKRMELHTYKKRNIYRKLEVAKLF